MIGPGPFLVTQRMPTVQVDDHLVQYLGYVIFEVLDVGIEMVLGALRDIRQVVFLDHLHQVHHLDVHSKLFSVVNLVEDLHDVVYKFGQ